MSTTITTPSSTVTSARRWLIDLFDPRGRCSRKGLAWIALVLLPAQLVFAAILFALDLHWSHPVVIVLNVVVIWPVVAVVIKRLHDLGRSWIWLPFGMIGLVVWSVAVAILTLTMFNPGHITPTSPAMVFNAIGNLGPMLAALLYLHFRRGQTGDNRFGPEPDASGFSRARRGKVTKAAKTSKRQPSRGYPSDAATA
ncbi:MAG: DUF805 domain-containing protein [Pseudomonadota bacterium]